MNLSIEELGHPTSKLINKYMRQMLWLKYSLFSIGVLYYMKCGLHVTQETGSKFVFLNVTFDNIHENIDLLDLFERE